ncbi:hypothetical protein [Streptomyces lavendulocolor]|uniref:hypothetical protein n=1 Tax=Streptomyces lavendulocolor TaxID=67316 RepID=UPI0033C456D3
MLQYLDAPPLVSADHPDDILHDADGTRRATPPTPVVLTWCAERGLPPHVERFLRTARRNGRRLP